MPNGRVWYLFQMFCMQSLYVCLIRCVGACSLRSVTRWIIIGKENTPFCLPFLDIDSTSSQYRSSFEIDLCFGGNINRLTVVSCDTNVYEQMYICMQNISYTQNAKTLVSTLNVMIPFMLTLWRPLTLRCTYQKSKNYVEEILFANVVCKMLIIWLMSRCVYHLHAIHSWHNTLMAACRDTCDYTIVLLFI